MPKNFPGESAENADILVNIWATLETLDRVDKTLDRMEDHIKSIRNTPKEQP